MIKRHLIRYSRLKILKALLVLNFICFVIICSIKNRYQVNNNSVLSDYQINSNIFSKNDINIRVSI